MKDVNLPLRKAYYTMLTGIIYNSASIPVYYAFKPADKVHPYWVIFGNITTVDESTMNSQGVAKSVQVTVHTEGVAVNDGVAADEIAGKILEAIKSTPQSGLIMNETGLQMVSTEVTGDRTENWGEVGQYVLIDRVLTFTNSIQILN
jgi:hypothetical protein